MTTYELTKQRLEQTAIVLDVIGMAIEAAARGEYELDVRGERFPAIGRLARVGVR